MPMLPVQDPDTKELHENVRAVFYDHTKKLSDFSPEYQRRLRTTYRFSGYVRCSDESSDPLPLSSETLDLM